MADLAALQAELQTLCGLAAGLEQDRVAVGVTVQLFHRGVLHGREAAVAHLAAARAQAAEARGAGLQQAQEQHRALTGQTGQQQLKTRVSRCSSRLV